MTKYILDTPLARYIALLMANNDAIRLDDLLYS